MTSRRSALLLGLGAAAGLAYLALMDTAPLALRALLKPLPVLALWAWCGPGAEGRGARWLRAGLLVSAAGDVLLVFPGLFLPGLAVFLCAHLLYTAGFLAATRRRRLLRALPFVLWTAGALAFLVPVLGRLVGPVAGYVLAICVMMWRAAATVGRDGPARPEEWWALGGAVLFGLSDTLLALHRFMTPWPDAPYLVMLLYWAGQAGLARSVRPSAGNSAAFRYHHAGPPAA